MRFNLHWAKGKVTQRFRSPLQETDYEGNELWAKAFPKTRPLTDYERYLYQGMAAMNQEEIISAAWQQQSMTSCYQRGLLRGLGGWL